MDPMNVDVKKKEDGTFYFDMAAVAEHLKNGTLGAIRAEMKDALEAEKRKIFPTSADGKVLETATGSIIDTSFFNRKTYGERKAESLDGFELGQRMRASGGPFIKLSPAMEKFAEMVRIGFDGGRMNAKGVNLNDYNKEMMEWNQKTAAYSLTTTDVGALVPIEFLATVIEFAIQASQILPKLWRIPMGSMTTRIPVLSQSAGSYFGGIILYHPDEAELKVATKPAFSYKTFTAHKTIGLCPLTDELVMDSAINIINYITGLFTRAIQYYTEREVINGEGTGGQMLGIVNDPGVNFVDRTTGSNADYSKNDVKADDVINLESAIDENIQDLTYILRRLTLNKLRLQKTTGGAPVYYDTTVQGLTVPIGPMLNGYPAIRTRNAPALGHQGDIICGDLGFYIWALRQDITIEMSKERYFEYDMTALRFVMRQDGKPGVPEAFSILQGPPQS
jgi:HK97 family phage major capsid protein